MDFILEKKMTNTERKEFAIELVKKYLPSYIFKVQRYKRSLGTHNGFT